MMSSFCPVLHTIIICLISVPLIILLAPCICINLAAVVVQSTVVMCLMADVCMGICIPFSDYNNTFQHVDIFGFGLIMDYDNGL